MRDDREQGSFFLALDVLETIHPDPPNNIKRKMVYRAMSNIINEGGLGAGVRKPHPQCVVDENRRIHPDEDGVYMGFKAN